MFSRPTQTILLITRDLVARADVRGCPAADDIELHRRPRPVAADLPSLVEAALGLSSQRARHVWVFTTELWTQCLSLPAEMTRDLAPDALARALSFEAEPFSGIAGREARVAFQPQPTTDGQQGYWLAALADESVSQIEYVVQRVGGRMAGIAHPAGLPIDWINAPVSRGVWRRIELWPGTIVCTASIAGVPSRLVVPGSARPGRWPAEVERWLAETESAGPPAVVVGQGASEASTELATFQFGEPDVQRRWLAGCAQALAELASEIPVVRPEKRPMSATSRRNLAAVLALAAGLVCAGHCLYSLQQRRSLDAQAEQLRQPAEQYATLKKQADQLQAANAKLRGENDRLAGDLESFQTSVQAQRLRFARLMDLLARIDPNETLVQKIEGDSEQVVLHGLCLRPEAANRLARQLAEQLDPLGWQVQLPASSAQGLLAGGGPWQFEIRMRESTARAAPNPAPAPTAGKPAKAEASI